MGARSTTAIRILAPSLSAELGRDWARHWPRWFGPQRVVLPRAPEKEHLALVETALGRVVAKREVPEGWKRSLSALRARPLRSLAAFRAAAALLARGLETPEPLAVLETRGFGACEAVLVTRYVEGCGPWDFLQRGGGPERLAETLAHALARLHAAGFRHRDLKASNLLLREQESERLVLVWTDLEGLRHLGSIPPLFRARDLARLSMSFQSAQARAAGVRADDWPGLVNIYLRATLGRDPSPAELGRFLERTQRWAEGAIRRNLARGRPVL